jgi:hypothetical protein
VADDAQFLFDDAGTIIGDNAVFTNLLGKLFVLIRAGLRFSVGSLCWGRSFVKVSSVASPALPASFTLPESAPRPAVKPCFSGQLDGGSSPTRGIF